MTLTIRKAEPSTDLDAIWAILSPVIAAGETYPLPRDMSKQDATNYWLSDQHESFVAQDESGEVLGTYYIRPNNAGGGAHIANCGYMVGQNAQGKGVARAMCAHSLEHAKSVGYRGIQFNFVIASNERAVNLWTKMGFATVGQLPKVFNHPTRGYVDAFVMFQPFD